MQGVAGSAVAGSTPTVIRETAEDSSYLACLHVAPSSNGPRRQHAGWFSACYRLTPAVQRISRQRALLDLGRCSEHEALSAMEGLVEHLKLRGFQARAGIGPNLTLAQFAALTASADQPLLLVTPPNTRVFLRRVPVTVLPQLHPHGQVPPEIVERLQQYGLHTLGHLTRLGEPALHRQFGSVGTFLARVAAGWDDRPLHPTPRPARYRIRLRFGSPIQPEQLVAMLGQLSERVATRLRQQGRQARMLCVQVRWETCGVQHARLSLRQYTNDPAMITQELRRLLLPLLGSSAIPEGDEAPRAQGSEGREEHTGTHLRAVEELRVILGDFALALPQQATFWRTDEQRWTAVQVMEESLARRHRRSLLLRTASVRPAAIFSEERYQLVALGAPGLRTERGVRHRRSPHPSEVPANPWQTVPQRLHWW
jgi:impB/mucB/samB family C-terminal domain